MCFNVWFLENHFVHEAVVCFGKRFRNDLLREADSNLQSTGTNLRQETIVVAPTPAQAAAIAGKCKPRAEKGVDFREWNFWRFLTGFLNPETTLPEIFSFMKSKFMTLHAWKHPTDCRMAGDAGAEIDLIGKWQVGGNCLKRWMGQQPLIESLADRSRVLRRVPLAHHFTQAGFG